MEWVWVRPLPPLWEFFPHNLVFFLTTFLILLKNKEGLLYFSQSVNPLESSGKMTNWSELAKSLKTKRSFQQKSPQGISSSLCVHSSIHKTFQWKVNFQSDHNSGTQWYVLTRSLKYKMKNTKKRDNRCTINFKKKTSNLNNYQRPLKTVQKLLK